MGLGRKFLLGVSVLGLAGAVAVGYYGKEFIESFGKYDCVFNRTLQTEDSQTNVKNLTNSDKGMLDERKKISHSVMGKCDFDFNALNKKTLDGLADKKVWNRFKEYSSGNGEHSTGSSREE